MDLAYDHTPMPPGRVQRPSPVGKGMDTTELMADMAPQIKYQPRAGAGNR